VCLPASKIGNRPCRYNGEIDKLGAFNYLTSEGKIIILLLLTKPYTFAQVPALAYQGPRLIIKQPVLAIIHSVGCIQRKAYRLLKEH
jgi:hypothetical protein